GKTRVEALDLSPQLLHDLQQNLMLFFTGAAHHSWTILEEQENSTRAHKGVAVEALHEIRSIAEQMRKSLEKGDLNGFGILLDEAWQAKKRISNRISTLQIDQLYQAARRAGALGGKITGAGGGGFLLLYAEPPCHESVRQTLA